LISSRHFTTSSLDIDIGFGSKCPLSVMTDRGHLDPNPIPISKDDVVKCLEDIKAGNL